MGCPHAGRGRYTEYRESQVHFVRQCRTTDFDVTVGHCLVSSERRQALVVLMQGGEGTQSRESPWSTLLGTVVRQTDFDVTIGHCLVCSERRQALVSSCRMGKVHRV